MFKSKGFPKGIAVGASVMLLVITCASKNSRESIASKASSLAADAKAYASGFKQLMSWYGGIRGKDES